MKCIRALRRIQAYFDGELPPGESTALEEHLRGCPSCSGELERLHALSSLVKGLRAPSVSPELWDNYSAGVLRKARAAPGRRIPFRERAASLRLLHPRLAYAAAAIFLVFIAAMMYHFNVVRRPAAGGAAPLTVQQRPIVEQFEAGDLASSVMAFAPENNPVAIVWVFGCRIENGQDSGEGTIL